MFSNAVIQFCLSIKRLFGLALRQAMGVVESLLKLAGLSPTNPRARSHAELRGRRTDTADPAQPVDPAKALLSLSGGRAYDTKDCRAARDAGDHSGAQ